MGWEVDEEVEGQRTCRDSGHTAAFVQLLLMAHAPGRESFRIGIGMRAGLKRWLLMPGSSYGSSSSNSSSSSSNYGSNISSSSSSNTNKIPRLRPSGQRFPLVYCSERKKPKRYRATHIHIHEIQIPSALNTRANPKAAGRRGPIYHFQITSTPPQAAAVGRAARHPRRPPPHFSAGSKTGRHSGSCSQLLTSATPNSNIAQAAAATATPTARQQHQTSHSKGETETGI